MAARSSSSGRDKAVTEPDEETQFIQNIPPPMVTRYIDSVQVLRENMELIHCILENQKLGRMKEVVMYQERLQAQLIHLAKLSDLQAAVNGNFPERESVEPHNEKTTHALLKKSMRMMLTISKLCPRAPSAYALSDEEIEANDSHPADKSSILLRKSLRKEKNDSNSHDDDDDAPEPDEMAAAMITDREINNKSSKKNEQKDKRRYWTEEEHSKFLEALQKFGPKAYKAIAKHVGTRDANQVRTHKRAMEKRMKRGDSFFFSRRTPLNRREEALRENLEQSDSSDQNSGTEGQEDENEDIAAF